MKKTVIVIAISLIAASLAFAGLWEREQYADYPNFVERVGNAMSTAAIAVKAETPESPATWTGETLKNVGDFVIPVAAQATGYAYKSGDYGYTGATQPTWPTTLSNTVVDGDITWTCVIAPTAHHDKRTAFADDVLRGAWNQNAIPSAITTNATIGAEIDLIMSAPTWQAATAYVLTDDVVPVTVNGYRYVCTSAGTTGSSEPDWPMTVTGTVTDGTVTWTCDGPTDSDIQFVVNSMWDAFSGVDAE